MGPNARVQRTVTPVQRSNGVSPTPNPRGVEGRDLAHPTLSLFVFSLVAPRVPALQVPGGRDFVYAKQ